MPDIEIALRLSMDDLQTIMGHLGRGAYHDVADVMHRLAVQVTPQIAAHQQRLTLAATPSEARN